MPKFAEIAVNNHPQGFCYLVHAAGCEDITREVSRYKSDPPRVFVAETQEDTYDEVVDEDLDYEKKDVKLHSCAIQLLRVSGAPTQWVTVNWELGKKELARVLLKVLPDTAERIDAMSPTQYRELVMSELRRVGENAYKWAGNDDPRLVDEIVYKLSMSIVEWVYFRAEWTDDDQKLVIKYAASPAQTAG